MLLMMRVAVAWVVQKAYKASEPLVHTFSIVLRNSVISENEIAYCE